MSASYPSRWPVSFFFLPSWKKIQFLLPPPLLGTLCKTVIAVLLLLAGWRRVERPVCGLSPNILFGDRLGSCLE